VRWSQYFRRVLYIYVHITDVDTEAKKGEEKEHKKKGSELCERGVFVEDELMVLCFLSVGFSGLMLWWRLEKEI
jgi:hypothetical protein